MDERREAIGLRNSPLLQKGELRSFISKKFLIRALRRSRVRPTPLAVPVPTIHPFGGNLIVYRAVKTC
jgi:hypothetical protein